MALLRLIVWIGVAGIAGADLAMAAEHGWALVNWWRLALPCAILATIALGYSISGRSPRIVALATCLLLWSVFAVSSAVLALDPRPVERRCLGRAPRWAHAGTGHYRSASRRNTAP